MIQALQSVDRRMRQLVPAFTAMIFLLLDLLPGLPEAKMILAALPLMAIFYWSARAPSLFPVGLAFCLGLVADLDDLTPFGAQAFLFTITAILLRRKNRIAEWPFVWLWAAFAVLALFRAVFMWFAVFTIQMTALPFWHLITDTALQTVLFPLIAKFCLAPAERLTVETAR